MGKRQVGELKPHELVITILISSVATIPLQEISIPLTNTILPILIFVSFEILESAISMKSIRFRNLVQGKPIFIIKNGVLQQKILRKLRFTVDDLVDALRQQGAFDISQVENAVVETNGTLSVQLKAKYSPITPDEINLHVDEQSTPITIVMDSKPVTEYFGTTKFKDSEIELITTSSNVEMQDILLMTVDDFGNTYIIKKEQEN
jgi:uncharacterized membrane protein YcaP (DUF421 family)